MKNNIFLLIAVSLILFSCAKKDNLSFRGTSETAGNPGKPDAQVNFLIAEVTGESGTLFEYIDQTNIFFDKYPEKKQGFNLVELEYFIDIKYDGKEYENIRMKVENDSPNQVKLKFLHSLASAITKGTTVQIRESALQEIINNKRNYLISADEIRMGLK